MFLLLLVNELELTQALTGAQTTVDQIENLIGINFVYKSY
jgi:hypothetical protein